MTAAYFDQWFADIESSPARQRLFAEVLGLPAEISPSNLLPLNGLAAVERALGVPGEGLLVDVACGRGGPGMWVARRSGCRLIGVDFSALAIAQATRRRELFGLQDRARFVVGTIDKTGLDAGIADGLMCVDAFQFAQDGTAAAEGLRRVLRRGGRIVLTSWEVTDRDDESLPARLRSVDLAGSLAAAGFRDIEVTEHTDWHELSRRLWQQSLTLDAAGDPALESTQAEAERSLRDHDRIRRVMATATAP
jgi:SAM-dependent methyltransferase